MIMTEKTLQSAAAGEICAPKKPLATQQLLNWIKATHEKTGRWPTAGDRKDKPVYGYDEEGVPAIVPGEVWHNLEHTLNAGERHWDDETVKSLSGFRAKHGLVDDRLLTTEKLENWLCATYEVTGYWPTADDGKDKPVYGYNEEDVPVIVPGEVWHAIHVALYAGHRGWDNTTIKGLSQFRKSRGLGGDLGSGPRPKAHSIMPT
jgi:hypothetical protein